MHKLDTAFVEWDSICEKHGPYRAKGVIFDGSRRGGLCAECAAERDESDRAGKEARVRAAKDRRIKSLLGSSGIPPRFVGRTFENFSVSNEGQKCALRFARGYVAQFEDAMASGTSCTMVGNPGTGKTHLAAAIAHVVIASGRSVHFTTVGRMLRQVKSTYGKDSDMTEGQAIKSYLDPDLLIIDEVGVQRGTEAERLILTEIMGARYENMLPMVVMGNCTEEELATHLGDRLMSRLREGGGPMIVCDWQDFRANPQPGVEPPRRNVKPIDWDAAE